MSLIRFAVLNTSFFNMTIFVTFSAPNLCNFQTKSGQSQQSYLKHPLNKKFINRHDPQSDIIYYRDFIMLRKIRPQYEPPT